jgi:hypothetical protein
MPLKLIISHPKIVTLLSEVSLFIWPYCFFLLKSKELFAKVDKFFLDVGL